MENSRKFSHSSSENSFKIEGSNSEYRLLKVVGKGTYSTVYLCEHIDPDAQSEDDEVVS
jgi:serine/threonine protein kinase